MNPSLSYAGVGGCVDWDGSLGSREKRLGLRQVSRGIESLSYQTKINI